MFSKECLTKVVGALLMLSPLPAFAQTSRPGYYYETPPEVRRPGPASGYGSTVTLGGGVMNFTGSGARGATSTGGAWGLRIGWGTRAILGAEAAYIGSANKMSSVPGLDPHSVLLGTGAEGNLRLNAPFLVRDTVIEPFALGGVGWTRFDIINDDFNTSGALEKDHVMTVPVGAGFAMGVHGLMVDARYTYRFVFDEDLLGKASLDNWIVSANIGSEF